MLPNYPIYISYKSFFGAGAALQHLSSLPWLWSLCCSILSFVHHCLSFSPFSFGDCIVCPSIYFLWIPLSFSYSKNDPDDNSCRISIFFIQKIRIKYNFTLYFQYNFMYLIFWEHTSWTQNWNWINFVQNTIEW